MTSMDHRTLRAGRPRQPEIVDGELRLLLGSELTAIEYGRLGLARFLAPLALDSRVVNRIEVIFEELIANIVRHGFKDMTGGVIAVSAFAKPDGIVLTIEDNGAPFNLLEAEEPAPFESLETARIGGLGIPLIRRYSRNIHYERLKPAPGAAGELGQAHSGRNRLVVEVPRR